jgi:hypothetical protein
MKTNPMEKSSFSQLESCGVIEQRISIQAQEDVYSMTKVKVTEFQKNEELTKKQFVHKTNPKFIVVFDCLSS